MRDKRFLLPVEKKRRMELYEKGLNDREIAEIIGKKESAITDWRHRRKLEANSKNRLMPMQKVLTPDQCKVMRKFLLTLIKAYEMNSELDISHFMKEYRKIDEVAQI